MARARYRKVFSEVYADDKFGELSPMQPSGQSLFLYLLTGPHCTSLPGVIVCGRAGLAEALGWSLEDFDRCFAELEQRAMVAADWKRRVIWLPNAIKHNRPENPNVVKSWAAHWREVPSCELKDRAARAILRGLEAYAEGLAAPFRALTGLSESEGLQEGLSKGFRKGLEEKEIQKLDRALSNQEQEQEQETYTDKPDDVAPGGPAEAPARARPVLAPDRARRLHPLDEPPTTRLSVESLALLDEFAALYPRKDTPRKLLHTVWLDVCPTPAQGERIVQDLRARLALGWPGDTPTGKLKTAANWLREEHFTTPLPRPAPGIPPERASLEGREVEGECDGCNGFLRGVIRNGAPVYDPCPTCAPALAGVAAGHDGSRKARVG